MMYLDLVNGVLKRLRESTVTTAPENDYSVLVGELVNDAKKQIELRHEWTALRTTLTFNTVVGTSEYTLTNAFQNAIFKQAMNNTINNYITQRDLTYFNNNTVLATAATGSPSNFMFNGTSADGYLKVQLNPVPAAIEAIRFDMIVPQVDLSADTDMLTIPSNPVLQLAFGMALRERGETGGMSAAEQFKVADSALSDAIAIDQNRYQNETYYAV
tara:strand:- start:127 stop:771 length:645 start_codon:yes stop_codon:yes gene_type:complete